MEVGYWLTGNARLRSMEEFHDAHIAPLFSEKIELAPPPHGLIVDWAWDRKRSYRIGKRASQALRGLRNIADIAGDEWWRAVIATSEDPLPTQSSGWDDIPEDLGQSIVAFVADFGPLVTCYPAWCARRKSIVEDTSHEGLSYDDRLATRPLLYWSNYASSLWDSRTGSTGDKRSDYSIKLIITGFGSNFFKSPMKEAAAYYDIPIMSGAPPRFPAPVALYVWAARMITDLQDSPNSPRGQEFLRNNLSMLTLYPRSMAKDKGMALSVTGQLIELLAYYAAFRNKRDGDDIIFVPGFCRGCDEPFDSHDGRHHYCEECRENTNLQNAIWQRDYRARRKRESQPE